MKLLSITGKEENIDGFISDYLLDSGMQTEDAVKVYEKGWKLKNFEYDGTAKELMKDCRELLDKYEIKYNKDSESENIEKSLISINEELEEIKESFRKIEDEISESKKVLEELRKKSEFLMNTKNLDIDLNSLFNLEYVKFRYGKITKSNLDKLEKSLGNLNTIIIKVSEDEE